MRKTKKKDLGGGISVVVTTMDADRGLDMFHKMIEIAGPGVLGIAAKVFAAKSNAKLSGKSLGLAQVELDGFEGLASGMMSRFPKEDLHAIRDELFELSIIETKGKQLPFLEHAKEVFAGDIPGYLKCFAFALEMNFSFFSKLKGLIQGQVGTFIESMGEAKAEESQSTDSTPEGGPSTG